MKEDIRNAISKLSNSPTMERFIKTMDRYKVGGYKNKISQLNLKYTNVPTTYPELTKTKLVSYLNSNNKYVDINDEKIVEKIERDINTIIDKYDEEMNNADKGSTSDMKDMYDDISQRCLNMGKKVPTVYVEALAKNSKYAFDSFIDLLERAERYKEQGDEDMTDYCMERAFDILISNIT